MPVGVFINSLAIFIGGVIGSLMGQRLSQDFKENLNMVFGVCSMGIGISSIVLMKNLPAVTLAVILGTAIGLAIHLGDKINAAGRGMQRVVSRFVKMPDSGISADEFSASLVTVIVLFCASGTGIYGSIISGMTGDHSILIAKSVLDLPTALIFGCTLGVLVALIAVPQMLVFLLLFFCAGLIFPLTTPDMIDDFKAVGGIIMLATGFRMIKVKMFPTADMIPAMILAMPVSWVWTAYIAPLVA
ncbi:MAG: DUF554 domain-containing protein [Oscillibacter sp.]|nr:DUF554 domain-containing protein [Oscillibacter sp.]